MPLLWTLPSTFGATNQALTETQHQRLAMDSWAVLASSHPGWKQLLWSQRLVQALPLAPIRKQPKSGSGGIELAKGKTLSSCYNLWEMNWSLHARKRNPICHIMPQIYRWLSRSVLADNILEHEEENHLKKSVRASWKAKPQWVLTVRPTSHSQPPQNIFPPKPLLSQLLQLPLLHPLPLCINYQLIFFSFLKGSQLMSIQSIWFKVLCNPEAMELHLPTTPHTLFLHL